MNQRRPSKLTYCGNVHAAGDLEAWFASLEGPVADVVARQPAPFGLGVWWSEAAATRLAEDAAALARARATLARLGVEIWTLNVFPFGDFHGEVVKTNVYAPDWASEARVQYTRQCAEVVAKLVPAGSSIPISTLPLGYGDGDRRQMARNLVRAASHLADLESRTGVHVSLELEPEPFCLLETVDATATFLEQWVFEEGAWTVPEDRLRRHLGVCVDLCHLAVVGEDPLAATADLAARGLPVRKVQVSSCLELRDPSAALDRLLAFDEPRYLHQTVGLDGTRALDLGEVARKAGRFRAAGRLRTHFHVPVFWDEPGPFGSTRAEVERFLAGLESRTDLGDTAPLLEIETYTWHVWSDATRDAPALVDGLVAELDFVRSRIRT